jgi:hypothetical protein
MLQPFRPPHSRHSRDVPPASGALSLTCTSACIVALVLRT